VDVLLIDDNPLMQQLIARFLGELGYRVGIAGLATEALALARQAPPGLFMIDMHLPDLDGPDALVALRALPGCAHTPAIAISGLAEEDAWSNRSISMCFKRPSSGTLAPILCGASADAPIELVLNIDV
jgi:CheY-like chemotaxis protein